MRGWMVEARKSAGLTQKQVGEKIGVSEAYYSYIEKGERQQKMDITLCSKLSDVFGIPIQKIVELEKMS